MTNTRVARFRSVQRILAVLFLTLLAAGCVRGQSAEQVVPSATPTPPATRREVLEYGRRGISDLVHDSDAAVIVTIRAIAEPRWNTVTGKPYGGDPYSAPVRLLQYRNVTIQVERALWTSPDLSPKPGDELVVYTFGNGTATGAEIYNDSSGRCLVCENNISGPLEVGQRNLMLLRWQDDLALGDGNTLHKSRVIRLTDDFTGNWTARGDQAVSILSDRTVPLDALIGKLIAERHAAKRPGDRSGIDNPLETVAPETAQPAGPPPQATG